MAEAGRHVPLQAHVLALLPLLLLGSCAGEDAPAIEFGKAECAYCRMNVMDRQFAAAIKTKGGRTYAFDSPECMAQHVADGRIAEDQIAGWWVCDHAHPGALLDATTSYFLHAPSLRSPMNGNVAAFASAADRAAAMNEHPGEALDWASTRSLLSEP